MDQLFDSLIFVEKPVETCTQADTNTLLETSL